MGGPAGKGAGRGGGVRDPEAWKARGKEQRTAEVGAGGGGAHSPGRGAGVRSRLGAPPASAHESFKSWGLLFGDLTGSVWLWTARAARLRPGKARGAGGEGAAGKRVGSLSHKR